MKKFTLILLLVIIQLSVFAQVIVQRNGSPDLTLKNINSLQGGTSSRMYFQTGVNYTGAMGTVGTSAATAKLSFFTGTSQDPNALVERMSIHNSGSIGIGTSLPTSPLNLKVQGIGFSQESLNGAIQVGFYTSNVDAYVQTHSNNALHFATNNGAAQMTLSTTGRLGIGTTIPNAKLEVKGKAKFTQQAGEDAAVEINGALKVSGTAPAAFVITTGVEQEHIIDHPLSNGNPNAMIFATHVLDDYHFYNATFSVEYDTDILKWKLLATSPRFINSFVTGLEECDGGCFNSSHALPMADQKGFYNDTFNILIITK